MHALYLQKLFNIFFNKCFDYFTKLNQKPPKIMQTKSLKVRIYIVQFLKFTRYT